MHGWVSAVGAVIGPCVVGTHVPVTAGSSHFWNLAGRPLHTRAAARQAEDPTASQLRHIPGRLAAIASRSYTQNTSRETNEGRGNCGDVELGAHSWKEELYVKGRQPVAYGQPRVGRDNPVGLWQWVIKTREKAALRDCGQQAKL